MEQSSVFERLSAQLGDDDRRAMLQSIRSSMESQAGPLAPEVGEPPPAMEEQFHHLSVWQRFLLLVSQIFRGRNREEVLTRWLLRDVENRVHREGGNAIDARKRLFREAFAEDLERVVVAARHIEKVVRGVGEHRTNLVLALAMDRFPQVHQDLMRKTDSARIQELNEKSERYLKRVLGEDLDAAMMEISPDARRAMRRALWQADGLVRLGGFPFGSMIAAFDTLEGEGRRCTFDYLQRPLTELYQLLVNFSEPLELALLEALVLLARHTERPAEEPGDEQAFQESVRADLQELLAAMETVRSFSQRYPLLSVLQLVKENPWWEAHPDTGGEEWLALYRSFMSDRIHRQVLRVSLYGQLQQRLAELEETCGTPPTPLPGLPEGRFGVESRHWFAAAALHSFVASVWKEVLPQLRIVLTSGEFYKSSNRAQFNDAYNEFERLPERLRKLETDLRPDEAWGARLGPDQPATERAKMSSRVDQELATIIGLTRTTVEILVNILGGILYARAGSSYDTLANYGQIGGRRNAEFVEELKDVHRRLSGYIGVSGEIDALERRALENGVHLESPVSAVAKHHDQNDGGG